jgi:hypothetical protein
MVDFLNFGRRVSPSPIRSDHSTAYKYDRLQCSRSIRILELLPDKQGAPLRCRMREVSLDDAPDYEAVSYVWGPPDLVKQIFCGDEVIPITRSCSYALHHLRLRKQSRRVWIDACCINQNSDYERNHQVGMMGDIYSNASSTLVWLGKRMSEDWHDDSRALAYISEVGRCVIRGKGMSPLISSGGSCSDRTDPAKHRLKSLDDLDEHLLHSTSFINPSRTSKQDVLQLFNKEWFSRMWVSHQIINIAQCRSANMELDHPGVCTIPQLHYHVRRYFD